MVQPSPSTMKSREVKRLKTLGEPIRISSTRAFSYFTRRNSAPETLPGKFFEIFGMKMRISTRSHPRTCCTFLPWGQMERMTWSESRFCEHKTKTFPTRAASSSKSKRVKQTSEQNAHLFARPWKKTFLSSFALWPPKCFSFAPLLCFSFWGHDIARILQRIIIIVFLSKAVF